MSSRGQGILTRRARQGIPEAARTFASADSGIGSGRGRGVAEEEEEEEEEVGWGQKPNSGTRYVDMLGVKLQVPVYDILPSATAVFSYAIGSRKLI